MTDRSHKSLGYLSPLKYAEWKISKPALSTMASGNHLLIESQPVVDKAVEDQNTKLKTLNEPITKIRGA